MLSSAAGSYAEVLVVAKSGGHFASIQAALDAIGGSLAAASASEPYLVWVAPGVYAEQVTMKEWVHIQGSGEGVTTITSPGYGTLYTGTVIGADHAELRFLTVENTGGGSYATAIYCGGTSPRLVHVSATASGATASFAVVNSNASPTMTHVTASGSGGTSTRGVSNFNSSDPTMESVTAIASGAGGTSIGVYNGSSSSPTMVGVRASGSGGTSSNYGIYNVGSSPDMVDVHATSTGGNNSRAVYNRDASPEMTNVIAYASGTWNTSGVYNYDGSWPVLTNVTATGIGGTNINRGVSNYSSHPTIHGSRLSGSTAAIYNSESTAKVAHSHLDGEADGEGFVCFAVCDEDLQPLDEQCLVPLS